MDCADYTVLPASADDVALSPFHGPLVAGYVHAFVPDVLLPRDEGEVVMKVPVDVRSHVSVMTRSADCFGPLAPSCD